MAFSQGRDNSITIEELLEKVSEAEILGHYLGIEQVPCLIHSPLRVDKHCSFSITSFDGKSIMYKDFKTGDNGSIFKLMQKYWNLKDGYEAVEKIYNDLGKRKDLQAATIYKKGEFSIKTTRISKSIIELKCKVREWKDWDLKYWEQYGITLPWLQFSNTYPISHIIITKDGILSTIPAERYAYAYVEFKDDEESLKIYQPYSENFKWANNHDASVWDLWQQLPEFGDDLIITSSRKDALSIWANTGIPSCSLQAESYLPKHHIVDILKSRFKRIWVLYDNDWTKEDNPGRKLGAKIANEYSLTQIEINKKYLSKDPSDLRKNHGASTLRDVIFKLLELNNPFK